MCMSVRLYFENIYLLRVFLWFWTHLVVSDKRTSVLAGLDSELPDQHTYRL